jgi:aminopeptidase N
MKPLWLTVVLLGTLSGFSFAATATSTSGLSQATATQRDQQIADVHYDLHLKLDQKRSEYDGKVTIKFQLTPQKRPVRIDFRGGKIQSVTVNGNNASFNYNDHYLTVDEKLFRQGDNKLVITYQQSYSRDGRGLYRFQDPVDQKVYLYTQFEPFDANHLFPCFDQPSLKATYALTVLAPPSWQVVTATRETKVVDGDDESNRKLWHFPRSQPFSTYIFSLMAGPYKVWEDDQARIPSRLMARQSLASYVEPGDWFKITRDGFDFFEDYFSYSYPFKKYDQILVPDFNAGAMENVGAVTFNEAFIRRGQETRSERWGKAATILHEMAHMWFGNLVTMQWWDDLWLNESFATYLQTVAAAHIKDFQNESMLRFNSTKSWAYYEDSLSTTHPIVADVPHTDLAFARFDGITYGKGAATLKQLHYLIGDNAFRKGLAHYFKTHQWQNTVMRDFISSMEKASGRSLQTFTDQWLKTASLNQVKLSRSCQNKRLTALTVEQSAAKDYPTLREHAMRVDFYDVQENELVSLGSRKVQYSGPRTTMSLGNMPCPAFVIPNAADHDFVKLDWHPTELKQLFPFIQQLPATSRLVVWQAIADQTEAAKLSIPTYLGWLQQQLKAETNPMVRDAMLGATERRVASYIKLFEDQAVKQRLLDRLANIYWSQFDQLDAQQDQLAYFDQLVNLPTNANATKLQKLLASKSEFAKSLDPDRRWDLVNLVASVLGPKARKLCDQQKARDPSSRGEKSYLACQTLTNSAKANLQAITPIIKGTSELSAAERSTLLAHVFPPSRLADRKKYAPTYLGTLSQLPDTVEYGIAVSYTRAMKPLFCNQDSLRLLTKAIDQDGLLPSMTKHLRQSRDIAGRCLAIFELSTQPKG